MGDQLKYRVAAPYVTVETAVEGGRANIDIPRGALLPDDVPQEQFDRLLDRGDVEPAAHVEPERASDPDEVPDGTIPVVLEWVGDDMARATKALHAEQLKGDKARMSLINDLTKIAQV
jgi:hypothetical protein